MVTSSEYDKAVEQVKRLERAIAHTPKKSIEFDDLNRQLNSAQRLLKDSIIANGPSESAAKDKNDVEMTDKNEENDVEMQEQEEKTSKRKPTKATQKTLSDTFFIKKARKEQKESKPTSISSAFKLPPDKTISEISPSFNPEDFPPLPQSTTAKTVLQKQTNQKPIDLTDSKESSLIKASKAKTLNSTFFKPPNTEKSFTVSNQSSKPIQNKSDQKDTPLSYKSTAMKSVQYNQFTHRFNMSIPGFQRQGESKFKGIHSVITALAFQLHAVDSSARILPWDSSNDNSHPSLAHGTVSHIVPNQSPAYINTKIRSCFITDKTHYRQGFRITTKFDIEEFMNTWNQTKREIDSMYGISQAETQFHHRFALVGICSGSSQKKDNTMLLDKLREMTQLQTLDGSWQSILVGDLTKALWDEASEHAGNELKMHGRYKINIKARKFDWAPTGLALYAPSEFEAKKVREILMSKYGKNVSAGVFPQWPDGSRMKFLPLSNANLSTASADKVATRIRFHSYLKAKEHTLDMPEVNPWETMPGCEQSLGEYLHSLTDDKGLPIFRHVVKKWTPDPHKKQWAITCYGTKKGLASSKLYNLVHDIRELYGEEASHFVAPGTATAKEYSGSEPSDVEKFYNDTTAEEDNEFVLEPGYQDLFAQNEMKEMGIMDGDSTLNLSDTGPNAHTDAVNEVTQETGQSPDSSLESESVGTNTTRSVHFDDSVASGTPMTSEELIASTIRKYGITDTRYQELFLQYEILYQQVTQHHNKASNIVKVFLRLLKSLKIQLKLPEGERLGREP